MPLLRYFVTRVQNNYRTWIGLIGPIGPIRWMGLRLTLTLLRSQLRSELEEENVASRVVAMALGCSGSRHVRRQNAYATLCANFHRRFRVRSLPFARNRFGKWIVVLRWTCKASLGTGVRHNQGRIQFPVDTIQAVPGCHFVHSLRAFSGERSRVWRDDNIFQSKQRMICRGRLLFKDV